MICSASDRFSWSFTVWWVILGSTDLASAWPWSDPTGSGDGWVDGATVHKTWLCSHLNLPQRHRLGAGVQSKAPTVRQEPCAEHPFLVSAVGLADIDTHILKGGKPCFQVNSERLSPCRCLKVSSFGSLSHFTRDHKVWRKKNPHRSSQAHILPAAVCFCLLCLPCPDCEPLGHGGLAL